MSLGWDITVRPDGRTQFNKKAEKMRTSVRILAVIVGAFALVLASSTLAGAHPHGDVVAIPANERAEITLSVPHGCGAAGTTEFLVQVPGADGEGQELDGWTVATESGAEDSTVIIWTGGPLPTDEVGEFTFSFTAPNNVGELLYIDSIQVCEDGERMEWTDEDPLGAYPAAFVLILEEGSAVAHSIDDIPEGTPGRDLLGDHDHGDGGDHGDDHGDHGDGDAHDDHGDEVTEADTDATTTTAPAEDDATEATASAVDEEDEGSPLLWIILGAVIVAVIGVGAYLATRNQSAGNDEASGQNTDA